jgi:hypothetical protein
VKSFPLLKNANNALMHVESVLQNVVIWQDKKKIISILFFCLCYTILNSLIFGLQTYLPTSRSNDLTFRHIQLCWKQISW